MEPAVVEETGRRQTSSQSDSQSVSQTPSQSPSQPATQSISHPASQSVQPSPLNPCAVTGNLCRATRHSVFRYAKPCSACRPPWLYMTYASNMHFITFSPRIITARIVPLLSRPCSHAFVNGLRLTVRTVIPGTNQSHNWWVHGRGTRVILAVEHAILHHTDLVFTAHFESFELQNTWVNSSNYAFHHESRVIRAKRLPRLIHGPFPSSVDQKVAIFEPLCGCGQGVQHTIMLGHNICNPTVLNIWIIKVRIVYSKDNVSHFNCA